MPSGPQRLTGTAAYDAVADTFAEAFPGTEPEQPGELERIAEFAELLPPPRRVLDAGCGAGRMMPFLADRGCAVEGVDLSPAMIRRAQTDQPDFPTRVASLDDLPYPDARFEGVFAWYSIIHTPDAALPRILREVARVLKPGGAALFAFQAGSGEREVGEAFRERGHDVEMVRYHRSTDDLLEALADVGLSEVSRWERPPQGFEREAQAVVVARKPA